MARPDSDSASGTPNYKARGRGSSSRDTRSQDYTKDWNRLRDQKARKGHGVEARTLAALLFYFGEHFGEFGGDLTLQGRHPSEKDKNKLFLVFNVLARAVDRRIGRLWSIDYQYRATPNTDDPAAYDSADVVSDLIRALDYKLDEPMIHWNRLFWMLMGGVYIEHVHYVEDVGQEVMPIIDPNTGELLWQDTMLGQTIPQKVRDRAVELGATPERFKPAEQVDMVGDVASDGYTPLNFFIDVGVRAIKDLAGDQKCYLADIRTVGWIKDTFGSDAVKNYKRSKNNDLSITRTRMVDKGRYATNLTMRDIIPALTGSMSDDDPDMAIVLTSYGPRTTSNPSGSRCIFSPDGAIYDETDLEQLKYEGIPCRDFHWRPNSTGFFGKDYLTDLIPMQKFMNKRWSQLGEASNSMIYEVLLLGQGIKEIPTDIPGVVPDGLTEEGVPMVQPMLRGQLPQWFPDTIKLCVEFIDAMGGADLLTQRQFPGQLRGPLAIPMLQEILDSEDGPLYRHLGRALSDVHQMRVNRVKAYYPPIRTLHYVGESNRDEVLQLHTDKILRAGYDFQISTDPASLIPELSSLREARINERLAGPLAILYINPRTGQLDPSKIATDMKYGDRQREARAAQGRKLARQLIAYLWRGEQLDPNLPMPFWPHEDMMDELEAVMLTTEWLKASMPVKRGFASLYEKHRQFLQAEHQAMQQAMQSQMMHGAIAQATQQAAATAASMATKEALTQVAAQITTARTPPTPTDQVRAMLGNQQAASRARPGGGPVRRPLAA